MRVGLHQHTCAPDRLLSGVDKSVEARAVLVLQPREDICRSFRASLTCETLESQ